MSAAPKHSFFYKNGLSIVLLVMMLVFWAGQAVTGWQEHNDELLEHGQAALSAGEYLTSGHFISATFENWKASFCKWPFTWCSPLSCGKRVRRNRKS